MRGVDIENAYNELVSSIDRESRRLKQILAEQQMKDEAERLKSIQVKHSSHLLRVNCNFDRFLRMN